MKKLIKDKKGIKSPRKQSVHATIAGPAEWVRKVDYMKATSWKGLLDSGREASPRTS